MVHQENAEVRQIVDIEEFPQRGAVAPAGDDFGAGDLGFMEPADEGRQHMRVLGVVVVVRAVEIGRHDGDEVGPILPVEILAVLQAADLRKGIGFVGLLQRARQQAAFRHRLGREAGIDAAGAQEFQLFAAILPGGMNDIHFEDHVLVHEISQRRLVRLYAADLRRRKEDILRPLCRKEVIDSLLVTEVQFGMCPQHQVRIPLPLQLPHDSAPHHPTVSGNIYFRILIHMLLFPVLRRCGRPFKTVACGDPSRLLRKHPYPLTRPRVATGFAWCFLRTFGLLFHDTFLQILGKVGADAGGDAFCGDFGHVVLDHQADEVLEGGLVRVPAELAAGPGRITEEVDDIRRAVEVFADANEGLADEGFGARIANAHLVNPLPFEAEFDAGVVEGQGGELADAVLDTGGDDEVFRHGVLEDQPHAFDIVPGIAPVAEAVQVAEVEAVLQALGDAGGGEGDLPGDEGLAAAFGFMVEEDAAAAVHAVGFAIFLDDPVAVELRHGVGAVGMERGLLALGDRLDLAVELAGRGLVDAAALLEVAGANGLQDAQDAGGVDIGGVFRRVEGDLDVALRRQVVDLVGADPVDHLDEGHGVAHVRIVEMETGLALEVRDPFAVIDAAAADDAVDVIALLQEELRQEAAVLAGHAGNECCLCHIFLTQSHSRMPGGSATDRRPPGSALPFPC